MPQNRNKLINLFVGNLSNAVLHRILEKAIFENQEIVAKYKKEIKNSWTIAKEYREKINPANPPFPIQDREEIRSSIIKRVKAELSLRISRGYKNLDISKVEMEVDEALIVLGVF